MHHIFPTPNSSRKVDDVFFPKIVVHDGSSSPHNPPIHQVGSPYRRLQVEGMEEDSRRLRLEGQGAAAGQGRGDLEEDEDVEEPVEVPKVEKPQDQHETLMKHGGFFFRETR